MESSDITKRSIQVIERVMQLHKPNYVESMIINFDHEMSGGNDYFKEFTGKNLYFTDKHISY